MYHETMSLLCGEGRIAGSLRMRVTEVSKTGDRTGQELCCRSIKCAHDPSETPSAVYDSCWKVFPQANNRLQATVVGVLSWSAQ